MIGRPTGVTGHDDEDDDEMVENSVRVNDDETGDGVSGSLRAAQSAVALAGCSSWHRGPLRLAGRLRQVSSDARRPAPRDAQHVRRSPDVRARRTSWLAGRR